MTAVRTVYIELRASAERLRADMADANSRILTIGSAGREAGSQVSNGMDHASGSVRKLAEIASEGAVVITAAHGALTAAAARYGVTVATSSSATEGLINSLRALRLAASAALPEKFGSVGFAAEGIAIGILTEETLRLINARGKLIEQQALISATTGVSMSGVERIHEVASLGGSDESTLQGLIAASGKRTGTASFNDGLSALGVSGPEADAMAWPDFLARVAEGFDSIENPAKRAALAVQLFGSERAAAALQQLTPAFATANAAANKFGLRLDEISRTQIFTFHQDVGRLKAVFTDWPELGAFTEKVKQEMEQVGAAIYAGARAGVKALSELKERLRSDIGIDSLRELSHGDVIHADRGRDTHQGQVADDLFAQAQGAAARQAQTLAGRQTAQRAAQERADAAYRMLTDDQAKRQANRADPSLLSDDQRFSLATQQQSSAQLAASIGLEVKALQDADATQKDSASAAKVNIENRIAANAELARSFEQSAESQVRLARITAQAEIDAMHDPHARAVAMADADVETARQRLERLKPIYESELQARLALIQKRADLEGTATARENAKGESAAAQTQEASKVGSLSGTLDDSRVMAGNARITASREYSAELDAAVMRGFDGLDRLWNEAQSRSAKYFEELGKAQTRANEIADEGAGATGELQVIMQKLQLQREYEQQIGHTGEQQIAYLNKIITLEQTARAKDIAGKQKALAEAQGSDDPVQIEKAANLQREIDRLRQELANAGVEGQSKMDRLKRGLSLEDTVSEHAQQVPGALGGALAGGIMDGKGIGRDIRDSLKGVGKEMLSDVLTKSFEQLVVAITGQTIATNVHTIATHAQTAATELNTLWLEVKGLLGFAAGGSPPVGVPSIFGEEGAEVWIPREPGTVIPHNKLAALGARIAAITGVRNPSDISPSLVPTGENGPEVQSSGSIIPVTDGRGAFDPVRRIGKRG